MIDVYVRCLWIKLFVTADTQETGDISVYFVLCLFGYGYIMKLNLY